MCEVIYLIGVNPILFSVGVTSFRLRTSIIMKTPSVHLQKVLYKSHTNLAFVEYLHHQIQQLSSSPFSNTTISFSNSSYHSVITILNSNMSLSIDWTCGECGAPSAGDNDDNNKCYRCGHDRCSTCWLPLLVSAHLRKAVCRSKDRDIIDFMWTAGRKWE